MPLFVGDESEEKCTQGCTEGEARGPQEGSGTFKIDFTPGSQKPFKLLPVSHWQGTLSITLRGVCEDPCSGTLAITEVHWGWREKSGGISSSSHRCV